MVVFFCASALRLPRSFREIPLPDDGDNFNKNYAIAVEKLEKILLNLHLTRLLRPWCKPGRTGWA